MNELKLLSDLKDYLKYLKATSCMNRCYNCRLSVCDHGYSCMVESLIHKMEIKIKEDQYRDKGYYNNRT